MSPSIKVVNILERKRFVTRPFWPGLMKSYLCRAFEWVLNYHPCVRLCTLCDCGCKPLGASRKEGRAATNLAQQYSIITLDTGEEKGGGSESFKQGLRD
jgi:hypothetical protein